MQRLEVSGAVRPIYGSLGVKRLITKINSHYRIRNVKAYFNPAVLTDKTWWQNNGGAWHKVFVPKSTTSSLFFSEKCTVL